MAVRCHMFTALSVTDEHGGEENRVQRSFVGCCAARAARLRMTMVVRVVSGGHDNCFKNARTSNLKNCHPEEVQVLLAKRGRRRTYVLSAVVRISARAT